MIYLYRLFMFILSSAARLAAFFFSSSLLKERLGFYPENEVQSLSIGYNVWLHAASAGEVNAITPFCLAFRKAKPGVRIVLTTTSRSGKKVALDKGIADAVFLAPLDSSGPLSRAFQAFRPMMVLVAETEIWPLWILRTAENGIPILMINGRISDKSFPSYLKFKKIFGRALNCFNLCLVQTGLDRERLTALGVSPIRVLVAGQMKYDLDPPLEEKVKSFQMDLGMEPESVLFTLGSLREGEEDQLLPLVPDLLALSPRVRLILCPRHLRNAPVYMEKLRQAGVEACLRTELGKPGEARRVVVLDTMGELSLSYASSRGAFVGGTLVPVGGHNVMEPALSQVPVVFGPHLQNVREASEALLQSGGGIRLEQAGDLVRIFSDWSKPEVSRQAGEKAFEAVRSLRGATRRTVENVLARWPLDTES